MGYNKYMNILEEFDTIAAPATPMGAGGVGVIRISGEKAFENGEVTIPADTMRILNRGDFSMAGLVTVIYV